MKYYFAYGSNLHPLRLEDRLGRVDFFSTGELPAAEILFNKAARDGSGKGNIRLVEDASSKVYGALYSISKKQERLLDRFEALGRGYHKIEKEITVGEEESVTCFTYQAMPKYIDNSSVPYKWYKKLVVLGAEYLEFPHRYIRKLKQTPATEDKHPKRSAQNELLIQKLELQ